METFQAALVGFADSETILSTLASLDLHFFGLNLGLVPSFANPSLELVVPLFSGIVALVFCQIQNKLNPGALSQSARINNGFTIFTVVLSVYLPLVTPVGIGLYWIAGNLFGIVVILILDRIYSPKRLASEALDYIALIQKTPEQLKKERQRNKELSIREKHEISRFMNAKKQLVFYAISGGQYKYYVEIINYILENSNIEIHYLTNDPDDALFQHSPERIIPYYISQSKAISVMMKLEADMLVTTVPDLQNYHIKRSIVQKDIEYVYVFHGFTSIHMVMRPGTLDYYDTVFCVGSHHVKEVRRSEELRNTSKKKLVKAGYGMFDRLLAKHEGKHEKLGEKPQILIAPSWQNENIMESCIERVLEQLCGNGYKIIIRPHPEYIRNFGEDIIKLQEQYKDNVEAGELSFEVDFKESTSMYLSDIVITDWSNTAYEFSFCTKRPTIFINTPMKILNPNYKDFGIEPADIFLRDKVGVSIDMDDLDNLGDLTKNIIENREMYKEQIARTVDEFMYYPRRSGEAGGKYIIGRLTD